MYGLTNKFDNTFDVMKYTISAMKEVGYSNKDIEDYIIEATSKDNSKLIDVSIDYINNCNLMSHSYNTNNDYENEFYNYTDNYDYCYDNINNINNQSEERKEYYYKPFALLLHIMDTFLIVHYKEKNTFFCIKICVCKKKVVLLHAFSGLGSYQVALGSV